MSKDIEDKKDKETVLDEKSIQFGKNLENILDRLEIKKIDLAYGIGMSKGAITNICKGYNYPHLSTIVKMANFLHIDIEELTNSDPQLELITEASQAYLSLKEALVNVGVIGNDDLLKKEHIDLFAKIVKDNKKLYQEPDKALNSSKLIVVPVESLPNND